jgi:hypothetical protein
MKDLDLNTGTPAGDWSFDKHTTFTSTTAAYGNWLPWDEVVTYLKLSKLGSRAITTWKNANCTFPVEDAEMKRSAAEIDGEYPTLAINSTSSFIRRTDSCWEVSRE